MTLARVTERLTAGLPQTIVLDAAVSLAATLPNGLALQWRDADPQAIVSSSAPERAAHARDPEEAIGAVGRPPLRLLVLINGASCASVPLVAGLRRTVPDDGATDAVSVELELIGWELRAATLRGAGDFGSYLELAWRRADSAADRFSPPPLNPMYLRRIGGAVVLESKQEKAA
jgi:hypothetical protein